MRILILGSLHAQQVASVHCTFQDNCAQNAVNASKTRNLTLHAVCNHTWTLCDNTCDKDTYPLRKLRTGNNMKLQWWTDSQKGQVKSTSPLLAKGTPTCTTFVFLMLVKLPSNLNIILTLQHLFHDFHLCHYHAKFITKIPPC